MGAMETKLLAPIHSVNCSHGNSIFCFPKITKVFHLWHFPILFCSILQKRWIFAEVEFDTNWKHLEFSPCGAAIYNVDSTWADGSNLNPGDNSLISPLIRFSRHSTSGNSLTFCPSQRLGEETSRFFGINFNLQFFLFNFFLLRDLQAVLSS